MNDTIKVTIYCTSGKLITRCMSNAEEILEYEPHLPIECVFTGLRLERINKGQDKEKERLREGLQKAFEYIKRDGSISNIEEIRKYLE